MFFHAFSENLHSILHSILCLSSSLFSSRTVFYFQFLHNVKILHIARKPNAIIAKHHDRVENIDNLHLTINFFLSQLIPLYILSCKQTRQVENFQFFRVFCQPSSANVRRIKGIQRREDCKRHNCNHQTQV